MPSIFNDPVELRHLRYFRVVAESGGFTRAAAEIGLAQPTLSQQIGQLERALGVELLTRGRRECRLTPAGDLVLRHARRILGDMDSLRRSIDDMSGLKRGTLRVAALPVLARRLLPVALANFHRDYPELRVTVLQMTVDEMAKSLSHGGVELGIGCLGASLGLKGEVLFSEEFVAICAPDDELAQKECVTIREMSERAIIAAPAGFGTRTQLMAAWGKTRMPLIISLEVEDIDTVLQAVSQGGGPAIVPSCALWGVPTGNWRVVKIARPALTREIGIITAQGATPRPSSEALVPYLRAAVPADFIQAQRKANVSTDSITSLDLYSSE